MKSTAILFGHYDRQIMGALQILILLLLFSIGKIQHLGGFYYLSLIGAAGFSIYQQKLIFHREKSACFKAFLNNNWFGLIIFVGLFLDYGL